MTDTSGRRPPLERADDCTRGEQLPHLKRAIWQARHHDMLLTSIEREAARLDRIVAQQRRLFAARRAGR